MTYHLLLCVTQVEFAFDDLDFTAEEQQSVIDSVVGKHYLVEVDDDEDSNHVLVETVTDDVGWCVNWLTYRQVSNN